MKILLSRTLVLFLVIFIAGGMACRKTSASQYKLTEIRLDQAIVNLAPGESIQLTATAVPAVANQPSYEWTSANTSVATVNGGLIKAIDAGETTVKVSSSGISKTAKVIVATSVTSVYDDTVISIRLSGADCPFAEYADYGIYIPTSREQLQGVLVLQHGCGMEQFGISRPYDLQYRAFARKWKLAVIETALYGNCGGWRDPASGSGPALLKVLQRAGDASSHKELTSVPWLLWGHSGGGHWTLGMLRDYPQRILAAVCYSPAFDPQWNYPSAASKVPVLTRHAGKNDANDAGVACQATSIHAFAKLRGINAPISIALNESQNHNLSYIRYIAIPFYESAMKQRLPAAPGGVMRDLDPSQEWLGDTLTLQLYKASTYQGDKKGLCLFADETIAKAWKEYYATGTVVDKTPPPAPFNLAVKKKGDSIELTWSADADPESGIQRFDVYKDGVLIGHLPETGYYQYFDLNGDNTLKPQVAPMKYVFAGAAAADAVIAVQTVNHFNLSSVKTEIRYTK